MVRLVAEVVGSAAAAAVVQMIVWCSAVVGAAAPGSVARAG